MINIRKLNPFGRMCVNLGAIPTSYKESLSYEEQLLWFCSFLENEVIPALNNNGEAVEELQQLFITLQSYVDNYFENLDIQEEINNKLDEMAESGQLSDIIAQYLQLAGLLTYDSVSAMKSAENIVNGSTLKTIGYYSAYDGGGAYYKAREVTNEDVEDDMFIIALHDNNLVAELIIEDKLHVLQVGAKGDGTTDDASKIQSALNYCNTNKLVLYVDTPSNYYKITSGLVVNNQVKGIIFENLDYTGVIRPTGENYVALTLNTGFGFYCENLSIGSSTQVNVNGVLFSGHVGQQNFKNFRVYNLNGYGFKINAIWDSLLENISVELCGNSSEYAFSMNNDGDTCNSTIINRLQVEQSNKKAIFIENGTLNCLINDIHSERTRNAENGVNSYYLGGNHTTYTNMRLNESDLESISECLTISGSYLTINDICVDSSYVKGIVEGVNGLPVYINNITINTLEEKTNQTGKIYIDKGSITSLNTTSMNIENATITNVLNKWNPGYLISKFNNCSITSFVASGNSCRAEVNNSDITALNSFNFNLLNLYNDTLTFTDNKITYCVINIDKCNINANVILDFAYSCKISNSKIDGDLTWSAGYTLILLNNDIITGSISSELCNAPLTNGAKGDRHQNYNITGGQPSGWVYNGTSWVALPNYS